MKILYFEPFFGGHRDSYYRDYLNTLANKVPDSYTIGLCVPNKFNISSIDRRIRIHRLPSSGTSYKNIFTLYFPYLLNYIYGLYVFRKYQYEVFHHMDIDSYKIPTGLLSLLVPIQKNYFFTSHWADAKVSNNRTVNLIAKIIESFLYKRLIAKSGALFTHGQVISQKIVENIGSEISNKIVTLPYPLINISKVNNKKNISKNKLSISTKEVVLLFFGGTRYDKGADILLDAIEKVKSNIRFKVIVAGQAEYFDKQYFLDRKRNSKIIKDKFITRFEYIKGKKIELYFNSCDAVVLPYRKMYSAQSGPLNLSIAFGRPILASDVSQIGYDVKKYHLGLVCQAENPDKLTKIIEKFLNNQSSLNKKFLVGRKEYYRDNNLSKLTSLVLSHYDSSYYSKGMREKEKTLPTAQQSRQFRPLVDTSFLVNNLKT